MKQKIKDSGMLVELKERSYFKKPSEIKRRKKNLAKSRQKYKQIKENNRHY
jgi:ribosomal protein S21